MEKDKITDPLSANSIQKTERPKKEEPKSSKTLLVFLVIIAFLILIALAIIAYLIFKNSNSKTNTPSPSALESETPTASPKKRVGWQTYENSRFEYSVQVPPDLTKEESQNGDGASFATWNPPMTIRAFGGHNALEQTLAEAADFDQTSLAQEGVANLTVVKEESITIGGESGLKRIFAFIAPQTGDASTNANAYVIKNGVIYQVELLIQTDLWSQYESMFDDVVESFRFI